MAQGPCLNPDCSSHGQPHPNCRCYAMAKGGAVSKSCQCCSKQKLAEALMAKGGKVDKHLEKWQSGLHGTEERDKISRLEGSHRAKMLEEVSSKTQHRPSRFNDNKKEFLLHRGVNHTEHGHAQDKLEGSVIHESKDYGKHTSWTTSHKTAHDFAKDYEEEKLADGGDVSGYKTHWKSEKSGDKDITHATVTHDSSGHDNPDTKHVARFTFFNSDNQGGAHHVVSHVDEAHRRNGLASSHYKEYQDRTGAKLAPHQDHQTDDAKALWANKKFAAGGSVKKSQGPLGLNLNDFKHVHSDDKATTLKHKNGHELRIAHNSIEPKMATALKALGSIGKENATANQAQESQDQAQYGKVIMKAKGGDIKGINEQSILTNKAGVSHQGKLVRKGMEPEAKELAHKTLEDIKHMPKVPHYDEGGGVWDKVKDAFAGDFGEANKAADDSQKAAQGRKKTSEAPKQGAQQGGGQSSGWGYAEGGNVGHSHMKMIADLINAGHHDAARKMYADGTEDAPVSQDDQAPMSQGAPADVNQPMPQEPDHRTGFQKMVSGWHDQGKKMQGMAVGGGEMEQPQTPAPAEQVSMAEGDQQTTGAHADAAPQPMAPPAPQPTPATAAQAGIGNIDQRTFESNQAPPQQQAMYNQQKAKDIHEILSENKAFQQDLNEGHVTPKTYKDLMFSNPDGTEKSTLGKLGAIFGMMLSSGGAGLAHQTPMYMEMMNKEIERDLDAQQKSVSNKQNAYKINQERLRDQAAAEGQNIDTRAKAYALTRMQMQNSAFHDFSEKVNAMPVGSQARQAAEMQLAMMNQFIQNDQFNMTDRLGAAAAYGHVMQGQLMGGSNGQPNDEAAFQNRQRGLRTLGANGNAGANQIADFNEGHHVAGIQGQTSRPATGEEMNQLKAMQTFDQKGKDVLGFMDKHTGTWNPNTRRAAIQKIQELQGFYNDSVHGGAITQGKDEKYAKLFGNSSPTDIFEQLKGNRGAYKEMLNSNNNRQQLLLSGPGGLGLPKQSAESDTIERLTKDGRTVIYDAKTKKPLRYK